MKKIIRKIVLFLSQHNQTSWLIHYYYKLKAKRNLAYKIITDQVKIEKFSNDKESVLFFVPHKSASSLINKILPIIVKNHFIHLDYSSCIEYGVKNYGKDYTDGSHYIEKNSKKLFYPKGFMYGPLRNPINLKKLKFYKSIYLIRDPRDVIVSLYYSVAFTHPLPSKNGHLKNFILRREKAKKEGLYNFSIDFGIEFISKTLDGFINQIKSSSNEVLIMKYEDWLQDTPEQIRRVHKFIKKPLKNLNKDDYKNNSFKSNSIIDQSSHNRSGASKQFLEEFSYSELKDINKRLKKSLTYFGYKI